MQVTERVEIKQETRPMCCGTLIIKRCLVVAAVHVPGAVFPACPRPALVTNVTVRTRAANNPAPKVWYRVPEGYKFVKGRAGRRELHLGVVPFRSLCRDGFVPLVGKAALFPLRPWRRVCHVSRTAVRADS